MKSHVSSGTLFRTCLCVVYFVPVCVYFIYYLLCELYFVPVCVYLNFISACVLYFVSVCVTFHFMHLPWVDYLPMNLADWYAAHLPISYFNQYGGHLVFTFWIFLLNFVKHTWAKYLSCNKYFSNIINIQIIENIGTIVDNIFSG